MKTKWFPSFNGISIDNFLTSIKNNQKLLYWPSPECRIRQPSFEEYGFRFSISWYFEHQQIALFAHPMFNQELFTLQQLIDRIFMNFVPSIAFLTVHKMRELSWDLFPQSNSTFCNSFPSLKISIVDLFFGKTTAKLTNEFFCFVGILVLGKRQKLFIIKTCVDLQNHFFQHYQLLFAWKNLNWEFCSEKGFPSKFNNVIRT